MSKLINTQGLKTFAMKKILPAMAISASLMTVNVEAASNNNYGELSKQLSIMNSIFKSSFQAQGNKALKSTKVDSLYLAGQGVVFTVNSSNSFFFGGQGYGFVMPEIIAPVAPIESVDGDVDIEFFSDDDDVIIKMELEHEAHHDNYRDLHEQQRELAYELRDVARESKDLAYQLRNVEKAEQEKLKAEQEALAKQKASLEKLKSKLEKKSKEIKVIQQKKLAKRQEQRKAQNALLTTTMVETLCAYGNSLKALSKNEHVSLVIKSAGDKSGRNGYKDQVYVFDKKDISDCGKDKINSEKLLSKANHYQF